MPGLPRCRLSDRCLNPNTRMIRSVLLVPLHSCMVRLDFTEAEQSRTTKEKQLDLPPRTAHRSEDKRPGKPHPHRPHCQEFSEPWHKRGGMIGRTNGLTRQGLPHRPGPRTAATGHPNLAQKTRLPHCGDSGRASARLGPHRVVTFTTSNNPSWLTCHECEKAHPSTSMRPSSRQTPCHISASPSRPFRLTTR